MFVVPDPARAAEIALSLAEAYRDDDELSDVRVGLAHGPEVPVIVMTAFGTISQASDGKPDHAVNRSRVNRLTAHTTST